MKQLVIIGARGQGKVVADIAVNNGYEDILFLDDDKKIKQCASFPVIGMCHEVDRFEGDVIVAIGNAVIRQRILDGIASERLTTLIHPNAVIANGVKIGKGSVVMAGAIVNPGTIIGEGCIINTSSSVDHDCRISDYVHISVGAHVAGTVEIKNRTWIGIGATICNNLTICSDCVIGAGAVVVKNIDIPGTYIGVPAIKIK